MAAQKAPCALPTFLENNRMSHTQFAIADLQKAVMDDNVRVVVIIPGKEVADTIAGVILGTVQPLLDAGIVSEIVVIDAASEDGTGHVAASHGAKVIQRRDIAPELGPSRGKGDALWRALLATDGDIVAFLDGDTGDPSPAHLIGILGPLLLDKNIQMVRACFDRPFKSASGELTQNEGGRVTEILARPLLNCYWPELSGFSQPLAGEFAARRELLEKLPFPVSYGVEIGTLIDTYNLIGLGAMVQVDVGRRQNAHQPLRKLTVMAQGIMCTAQRRAGQATLSMARMYLPWESGFHDVETIERPPVSEYKSNPSMARPRDSNEIWPYPGPPFVNVEGVRMFRDIGRYHTVDGRTVRPGLVFRSGEPSKMSLTGQEVFKKLGIRKVFDFRSPIEIGGGIHGGGHEKRADSGIATPEEMSDVDTMFQEYGIEKVAAQVFPDEDWLPKQRDDRLQQYASAAEGYAKAYHHTLTHGKAAFLQIFKHLAQPSPSPILVHCSAGKDRTGVITMLLLRLAGCSSSTVAYEYALNDLDSDWRSNAVQRLLAQPGLAGNVDSATNVVRARGEFMVAAVAMLDEEFGGVMGYLYKDLGLDEKTIAAVKENLLLAP